MFTDRFIKVPIKTFSEEQDQLMGKSCEADAIMRLNPMEVTSYFNSFDPDFPETETVDVTFKNGLKIAVYLTIDEFEKLINNYG